MRIPLILCLLSGFHQIEAVDQDLESKCLLFAYSKAHGLGAQVRILSDLAVFKDGTQIQGTLTGTPTLSFSFGSVNIPPKEIDLISTISSRPGYVLVKTVRGEAYIGKAAGQKIVFREMGPKGHEERSISLEKIAFVLMKPQDVPASHSEALHLTLHNNETFPVLMVDPAIELTDGFSTKRIEPKKIIELSFNGGLYGRLMGKGAIPEELPLSFVKSPIVNIVTLDGKHSLRMPWTNIFKVQKDFICEKEYGSLGDLTEANSTEEEKEFVDQESYPEPIFSQALEECLLRDIFFEQAQSDVLLAVGEDFDLNGVEQQVETEKNSAEEFEFMSLGFVKKDFMLAVGEDFDLDDLDEEVKKIEAEKTNNEEWEFAGLKIGNDHLIAVGKDFDLEELDHQLKREKKTEAETNKKDEIQFISYGSSFKIPFKVDDAEIAMADSLIKREKGYFPGDAREDFEGLFYIGSEDNAAVGFFIAPRLVTNSEYQQFIREVNQKAPHHWVGGKIPKGTENQPVINVTYKEAYLYSVWSGKRLPTYKELEKAMQSGRIASNQPQRYAEWTSTPTFKDTLVSKSARAGSCFSSSHQVFGKEESISMHNGDSNHHTGFRLAADAF